MNWISKLFMSTLGRKLVVALTGLFLILFLAVHVAGNTALFFNDDGKAFNEYTIFMSNNPLIQTVAWLTKGFIILHIVQTLVLYIKNKKARPINYAYTKLNSSSSWSSRNMGILGSIILIFMIIHLKTFWFAFHFQGATIPMTSYDAEMPDYFYMVKLAFSELWYVVLYLLALVGLSFHLWHGFRSSFQTLGLNHPKYNPLINGFSGAFAIIVPLGFATQPLYMYFTQL